METNTIVTSKLYNFFDRVILTKYPNSNSSPFNQGLYSRQHQYQSPKIPQYPVTRQIIYDGSPTISKNTFFQSKTIHKDWIIYYRYIIQLCLLYKIKLCYN